MDCSQLEVGYPEFLPRSDLTHQTSPTTTNRSKSLPTDPIQFLWWLDAHGNTHRTLEITFPNELWKERIAQKSCPFAQNRYWLRHFHKCRGHAELDFCGSTSISNAVRNSGGLKTSVPAQLLWNRSDDLYIYLIITTAFLEGVIWQISVSAPSARKTTSEPHTWS